MDISWYTDRGAGLGWSNHHDPGGSLAASGVSLTFSENPTGWRMVSPSDVNVGFKAHEYYGIYLMNQS